MRAVPISYLDFVMNLILYGFLTETEKIANLARGYAGGSGLGGAASAVPSMAGSNTSGSLKGYRKGGVVRKEDVVRVAEGDKEEVILPKSKMKSNKDKRIYSYVRDKVR